MGEQWGQEYYRALIENARDAISILNGDGTYLYVSPSSERITGYPPEELLGRKPLEHVHPDDVPILARAFAELLESPGGSKEAQYRIRSKDGDWRYMQAIGTNLLDNPDIRGIVVNSRDVTDRQLAEEDLFAHQVELETQNEELRLVQQELEQSRDRYADLYDFAPLGYAGFDANGIIIDINLTGAALLASERGNLIGRPFVDHVMGEDRALFHNHLRKCREASARVVTELRLTGPDGQALSVELATVPYAAPQDASAILRTAISDVTERKRAEESLRESEERYRSFFENASIGIAHTLPEGRFIRVNPALVAMLGYASPEELLSTITDISGQLYVDARQRSELIGRTSGKAGWALMEARLNRKDGAIITADVSVRKVLKPDGTLAYLEAFMVDITERKAAEEALAKSEEKFRVLSDQSLMGIHIIQAGEFKYVNQATADICGFTIEEILRWGADEYAKVIHPDDLPLVLEQARRKQAGEQDVIGIYEWRMVTKSGEFKWIKSYSRTITYGEGLADFVMMTDVTERKAAEEQLKLASDEWRETFDAAEEMIMLLDAGFRIVKANQATADYLALPVEEIIGKPCHQLMHGSEEPLPECPLARMLKTREHEESELFLDGSNIWASVAVDPILDGDGNIVRTVHIARDITARKRTMERLEQLNRCFLSLGTDPRENVIKILRTGRDILDAYLIKYCCPPRRTQYLCLKSGISSGPLAPEADGCSFLATPPQEGPVFIRDLALLPTGSRHPDVARFGLRSVLVVPVRAEQDTFGSLCLFSEAEREFTSEERELLIMLARAVAIEEERLRHEENLRDFIDIASHELRHPITIMKGYSLILKEQGEKVDEGTRDVILNIIDHGADRLDNLVGGLLDISRIERGKFEVRREAQALIPLIERAIQEMSARGFSNDFTPRFSGDLEQCGVDGERFVELMILLLENAVKYSPSNSPIEVEAGQTDEGTLVSVLDRGMGVSEHNREHVFDRFFQVEEVAHHSTPGMGMGLYIARNIVEAHGGRIWVEPREGEGSAFCFTIPSRESVSRGE